MTVKFEKDGLFNYQWNSKQKKYVRQKVKKINSFLLLRENCEIAEGLTLGDIFNAIKTNKYLKVFFSQYSSCDVEAFFAQAELPYIPDEEEEDKLDYLELNWETDYDIVDGENWLSCNPGFIGFGTPKETSSYKNKDGGQIAYGVGLTPVNELMHLPIKLNTEFKLSHDGYSLLNCNRIFTLQEVLDGIFYEISFYGGPDKKTAIKEELTGKIEDLELGILDVKTLVNINDTNLPLD